MSSSFSPEERLYDFSTQQWARWSKSRRCYVGESDGRAIRDPQTRLSGTYGAIASKQTGSSSKPTVGKVSNAMGSLTVGSPPMHRTQGVSTTGAQQPYVARSSGYPSGALQQRTQTQSGSQSSTGYGSSAYSSYIPSSLGQRPASQPTAQTSSLSETHQRKNGPQDFTVSTPQYGSSLSTKQAAPRPVQNSSIQPAAPYNATSTDPRTGSRTQWTVSGSTEYRDPQNAKANRVLNVKSIRQVEDKPRKPGRIPESEFGIGRVIEVLFPESVEFLSNITPTLSDSVRQNEIRLRRFVVIRPLPDCMVEAIAIKTYRGRGVSAPGVIKSHHSIVYTGQPTRPLPEELPGRGGRSENGMQPGHIKVLSDDRGKALDPMSRLDYADRYEFDLNVSNIRTFGRVHSDSLAALYVQYNSVWSTIRTAVLGPAYEPTSAYAQSSTATATGLSIPPKIGHPGSSAGATVGSSQETHATQASTLLRKFAPRNSGRCSVEDMTAIIQYLRQHAARHHLDPPVVNVRQMQELANNPDKRADYIQLIRDTWRGALSAEERDEDSSEDGSDEDESEEENITLTRKRP